MKTFKEQLRRSQKRHKKLHNEVVSDYYVITKLRPDKPSKRQLLSIAINQGLTLKVGDVRVLLEVFPDTPVSEWVNVKHKG